MTDIVDWLNGVAETRRRAFGEEGMAGDRHKEAADEIERLRLNQAGTVVRFPLSQAGF